MAGKRKSGRGFAGQYCIESVDFWFADPRTRDMTPNQKLVFFYLNLNAIRDRSEWVSGIKLPAFLQHLCGVDARVVSVALAKLQQLCLIGVTPENDVIIYGVKRRHENLRWKSDGISNTNETHMVAQAVSDKRLRDETRADGAVSRVAQVSPPPSDYMTEIFERGKKKLAAQKAAGSGK
jgi:hypothetical protein